MSQTTIESRQHADCKNKRLLKIPANFDILMSLPGFYICFFATSRLKLPVILNYVYKESDQLNVF